MLLLSTTWSTSAQTVVTLMVEADGDVAAAITDASLPAGNVGFLDLTITDDRGLSAGWDISLAIHTPETDIALLGRAELSVLAGQAIVTPGPNTDIVVTDRAAGVLYTAGTPPAARVGQGTSVLRSAPGAGSGSYRLNLAAAASALPEDTIIELTVSLAP